MTTIFSKEIERLEKGCGEIFYVTPTKEALNKKRIAIQTLSSLDFNCEKGTLCPICEEKKETLKQAEQKHLKFVEELKKRLRYNLVEKVDFITLSETAFKRDVEIEIDNLSKGDELK